MGILFEKGKEVKEIVEERSRETSKRKLRRERTK